MLSNIKNTEDLPIIKYYIKPKNFENIEIDFTDQNIFNYYIDAESNTIREYDSSLKPFLNYIGFKRKTLKKDFKYKSIFIKNKKKSLIVSSIINKDIFNYQLSLITKRNNFFANFFDIKNQKTISSCSSGKYKIQLSKKTLRFSYASVLIKFLKSIKKNFFYRKKNSILKRMVIQSKRGIKKFKRYKKLKQKKQKNKIKDENGKKDYDFNDFGSFKKIMLFKIKKKKILKIRKNSGLVISITASSRLKKKIARTIKYTFKKLPIIVLIDERKIYNGCRAKKQIRKKRMRFRIFKK